MFNGFMDSVLSIFSRDSVIEDEDTTSNSTSTDSSYEEEDEISSSSSEDVMVLRSRRSTNTSETESVEGINLEMDCMTTDAAPRPHLDSTPIDLSLEDLCFIESLLDDYEKVSLLFLLYNRPFKSLEQITILLEGTSRNVLNDWRLDEDVTNNHQWKEKFVEALAIIQNYQVPKKVLGIDKNQLNARFLPNVPNISVHIKKSRKVLYRIMEMLSSKQTNDLLKFVQSDQKSKGFVFKTFDFPYLELYFLHWEHLRYIHPSDFKSLYKVFKQMGELGICDIIEQVSSVKKPLDERLKDETIIKKNNKTVDNSNAEREIHTSESYTTKLPSLNTSTDNAVNLQSIISQDHDNRYDIDPRNPGVCLIINQEYFYREVDQTYKHLLAKPKLDIRSGTEKDKNALKELFENYGFRTIVEDNLNHLKVLDKIRQVVNSLGDDSSIFICIMSHGDEGIVYGVNSCWVKVEEIQRIMSKSKKLIGKPKILLLQSCQGNKCQKIDGDSDDELQLDGGSTSKSSQKLVPGTADMLTFWATVPGYGAIRHKTSGSWFIQSFCDNVKNIGNICHLQDICTRIILEVTNKKWNKDKEEVTMVPVIVNTFRKSFYFPSDKLYIQ